MAEMFAGSALGWDLVLGSRLRLWDDREGRGEIWCALRKGHVAYFIEEVRGNLAEGEEGM